MDRDYKVRCTVPMINRATGKVDFDLTLYGLRARDVQTVPNTIVDSLARRYPDHKSSLFFVRDGI